MTSSYTRGDSFSCGVSREHIERALLDHGTTDVLFSQRGNVSAIAFRGGGRQFRIVVSLPQPDKAAVSPEDTAGGQIREVSAKDLERATRRMWHAVDLAIDAKLRAVAAGAGTLETEFLAHVVLPGGCTVFEQLKPVIDSAYRSGLRPSFPKTAPFLPGADPQFPVFAVHDHTLAP